MTPKHFRGTNGRRPKAGWERRWKDKASGRKKRNIKKVYYCWNENKEYYTKVIKRDRTDTPHKGKKTRKRKAAENMNRHAAKDKQTTHENKTREQELTILHQNKKNIPRISKQTQLYRHTERHTRCLWINPRKTLNALTT